MSETTKYTKGNVESPLPDIGSRRSFLNACVRYPIVAGLGLLGGWLAFRETLPTSEIPCIKQRVCGNCQLLPECKLPEAETARNRRRS